MGCDYTLDQLMENPRYKEICDLFINSAKTLEERETFEKILLEYTHTSEEKKDLIIKYSPVKVIPNENEHNLSKKREKKKKDLTIKYTAIKMLKNTTNNNNYSLKISKKLILSLMII